MTRKIIQEINVPSNQDIRRKVIAHKNRMPIVKCPCGYEILLVPDLKAMNLAINKHLDQHKKAGDNIERLNESLARDVISLSSKTTSSNAHKLKTI
jgi:hypothetical protein